MGNQSQGRGIGRSIIACLNKVLERCAEIKRDLIPHEGVERFFRDLLKTDLIAGVLGWPQEKIMVGERFDILLKDQDGFPVITIETKAPYRKASKKEYADFEARLLEYGSLRTAYFTNGVTWERLDISAPSGISDVGTRRSFNLKNSTPEEAQEFFEPMVSMCRVPPAPRTTRHAITRENRHILKALAADLDQTIRDLAFFFERLLSGLSEGKAGEQPQGVAGALFDFWCEKSPRYFG
jgi:hypothetical protein